MKHPPILLAFLVAAHSASAQPLTASGKPTDLSGIDVTVHKATELPGLTVRPSCALPSDSTWADANFELGRGRRQVPSPGTAESIQKYISLVKMGSTDYREIQTDALAAVAKSQFRYITRRQRCLGDFKSITFLHVTSAGWDDYELDYVNGAEEWAIAPSSNGRTPAQLGRYFRPQPLSDQLREFIESMLGSRPDYKYISPDLIPALNERRPLFEGKFRGWEAIASIYFVRRSDSGAYVYLIDFVHRELLSRDKVLKTAWSIATLPDGKIDAIAYKVLD